jgi:putative copper export protein
MKFTLFVIIALLIGIGIGSFYIMDEKEKANIINRKTKILAMCAIISLIVLFAAAAILSTFSIKLF